MKLASRSLTLNGRFHLLLLKVLAHPLTQPPHAALRAPHLLADLLRRIALQAQLDDGPLVPLQTPQQLLNRLSQHDRLVRGRLTSGSCEPGGRAVGSESRGGLARQVATLGMIVTHAVG